MGTTQGMFKSFSVESGPNRNDLVNAFLYAYDPAANIPITFMVAKGYTMPIGDPGCAYEALEMRVKHITELQHEDGSGYSFNIKGSCSVALGATHFENRYDTKEHMTVVSRRTDMVQAEFEAYYNARSRKGKITFFW